VARVAQQIPKIGLVMEQVRIANWLKQVGDTVKRGEPILEVETEKSVVEIEAVTNGVLIEIVLTEDADAGVGDIAAWIDGDEVGDDVANAHEAPAEQAAPAPSPIVDEPATIPVQMPASERVPSSPVARRMAREHGLDLRTIVGSGPRGRIQLIDVENAVAAASVSASAPATPMSQSDQAQTLTPMRRALARAMHLSNATIPQFVVERSVDWSNLQQRRSMLNASRASNTAKLTVNDFLIDAVATALLEFPRMNAIFDGDAATGNAQILPAQGAHIGLVVAVDDGLIVPVLHNVDRLTLGDIANLRDDCVTRGLAGKLKADELSGATFSISNLGLDGPDRFTAIINPPQSAILAIGRPMDQVIARDGAIMIRPMSALALTVDHRLIDGRLASDFLARVVTLLEAN